MEPPIFEFSKETFDFIRRYHYEMDNYGSTGLSLFNLPADFPTEILGFEITPEKQRHLIKYMQVDVGTKDNKGFYIFLYEQRPHICLCTHDPIDYSEVAPDRFLLATEVRSNLSHSISAAKENHFVKAPRVVIPSPPGKIAPRRPSG